VKPASVTRLPVKPRPKAVEPATVPAPELTLEQRLAILEKETSGALANAYLQIRNAKREHKRLMEACEHQLEVLAMAILSRLEKEEQDGYSAGNYVVYRYGLDVARVVDAGTLRDFILQAPAERLELLKMQASLDGARNWGALHAVEDPETELVTAPVPPGVELATIVKLGVRKK
jgi:hypothetical protein